MTSWVDGTRRVNSDLLDPGAIFTYTDPISSLEFEGPMEKTHRDKLVARINRKGWWHVPPADAKAYEKRGKFLASTFRDAEFWGRPLGTPIRVNVVNPLVGDEPTIETELLGAPAEYPGDDYPELTEW